MGQNAPWKFQIITKTFHFPIKIQITGEAECMPGKVVSKTLAQNDAVSVTFFAFEKGGETG